MDTDIKEINPDLMRLQLNRDSGYKYRERRHADWLENYTLYRDKVIVNRLTQRQSVNVPLMKQTIRTLLKDVDDMPDLVFENRDNDKDAEIFLNAYWQLTLDNNNADLQDIVDKKQVFMYGRSFDQWQVVDGKIKFTVQDPEDMLVDRYTDPHDLDSARYFIHTHIFKTLSELEANENYDQGEVARLKQFYATEQGLVKQSENQQSLNEKNEKLSQMGVTDIDTPILGETYVELSLHFVKEGAEYRLYVEADDQVILFKKGLEEVIGTTKNHFWKDHLPYVSWADDLERQDFWSDAVADIVRTPNKVLNSWISQLVENRTLRNYGMHYYNSSIEGFNPEMWEATPWGWYGVPVPENGSIDSVMKKVDIPDLSESLDEMTFLTGLVEKATGATATQQGNVMQKNVTLGEVQLALGEAKERSKGMAKFYLPAWRRRGLLFIKLVEASGDKLDSVRIEKKGRNSNDVYTREIGPKDWATKSGYSVKVWSQDEKETNDTNDLQKLQAVKTVMPNNQKLNEIYQRKLLTFAGCTPDQVGEIMEYEKQMMTNMGGVGMGGNAPMPNQTVGQPPQKPNQAMLPAQAGGKPPMA